jgi:beta-glucanase (GH16 family)
VSLRTLEDKGFAIKVLDTEAHGDYYSGAIQGVQTNATQYPMGDERRYIRTRDGTRVGGLVWTKERFGGGRYEVRMKNLPLSGGCSCIWTYYQAKGEYSEIDIEMPANGKANLASWSRWAGLNTYYPTENNLNERRMDLGTSQNDGRFHIYRWDWFDGTNGEPRVDFYLDGKFVYSSTKNVPRAPAQLWVGNWPAVWSGDFKYDIQHLYVDWVKITAIRSADFNKSQIK